MAGSKQAASAGTVTMVQYGRKGEWCIKKGETEFQYRMEMRNNQYVCSAFQISNYLQISCSFNPHKCPLKQALLSSFHNWWFKHQINRYCTNKNRNSRSRSNPRSLLCPITILMMTHKLLWKTESRINIIWLQSIKSILHTDF